MKRNVMQDLIRWKNNPKRKPLIIQGARQVGKTWLMKEFGKTEYEDVAYINFDSNSKMAELFSSDLDTERLILGIEIYLGRKINADHTLLIFDEIQEVPRALTSLKYFCENAPQYAIVCAGSLLGIALHEGTSFPVGKVDFLELYPLSFPEFLSAIGHEQYVDLLKQHDFCLITGLKQTLIEALRYYYYVGGMPEVVQNFVLHKDLTEVRDIQKRILVAYEQDFSKHAPSHVVPRLHMVWNGITSQLSKENKKFVFSVLREGARAKDFELAIQWLVDCGLCHKVSRVTKGAVPLIAYCDSPSFKLYFVDVGLLTAMADIDAKTLLSGNAIFAEFKGAITEQYVCQQLRSEVKTIPYYWSADRSSGEVDFIVQHNGRVLPIEVKAEENLSAKSLKCFVESNQLPTGIRTSMSDYRTQDRLLNLPLYAISELYTVYDSVITD